MKNTSMSLSKLWFLLREKEKQLGLDKLSLTERDIFLCILFLQEKNKIISLENLIKNCRHTRATLFRCLKKLRLEKIIQVKRDTIDTRKTLIFISSKYL
jgi:DNA-binding MarR family transcriptional regulator